MGIQNPIRFFVLSASILLVVSGCGDAFRRGNFSQASSTPGYTTVAFGNGVNSQVEPIDLMEGFTRLQDQQLMTVPESASVVFAWNENSSNRPTSLKISGANGSLTLPNATYSFGLIGSSASPIAADSSSTVYTALGKINGAGTAGASVVLNGTSVQIVFQPASATDPSDIFQNRHLNIGICNSSAILTNATSSTSSCSTISGSYGMATGIKIVYAGADITGNPIGFNPAATHSSGSNDYVASIVGANSLVSGCLALGGSTGITVSSFSFPHGYSATDGGNKRLRTFIVSYTGTNCASFYKVYEFPKGVWAASNSSWDAAGDPNFIVREKDTGQLVSASAASVNYVTVANFASTPLLLIKE